MKQFLSSVEIEDIKNGQIPKGQKYIDDYGQVWIRASEGYLWRKETGFGLFGDGRGLRKIPPPQE